VEGYWLDSLCYYVWLKKLHHRPVIYAPSLRKISAGINCSPTTVKTHISVLIKQGLAHYSAGYLHLKSTNSFEGKLIAIGVSNNKSQQRDLLRFALIKRNIHCQFREYNSRNDVLKFMQGVRFPYKVAKRLYKKAKRLNLNAESYLVNDLTLSNKKIGELCERSQSTGLRIQKSFNNLYLIKSYKRVEKVETGHNRRSFFEKFPGQAYFLSDKGTVFKRLSNGLLLRGEASHE